MLDWMKYITIAKKFQFRAKFEDRDDLCNNIILALAEAEIRNHNGNNTNGDCKISDKSMYQIARYECQKYWRQIKRHNRLVSLNRTMENGDGSRIEFSETLPDEKTVDLDAWLDAKTMLLDYPKRLVEIANKTVNGKSLDNKEHQYLWRYRQKSLNTR